MVSFTILGEQVEFHEDLKRYYDLSCKFDEESISLGSRIADALSHDTAPTDIFQFLDKDIRKFADSLINTLADFGVVDRTVDDFLGASKGYLEILESITGYYEYAQTSMDKHNANASTQKALAKAKIGDSVRGLDFGIISSSIIDHVVYNAMNESAARDQLHKASQECYRKCQAIEATSLKNILTETKEYYNSIFSASLLVGIPAVFSDLLARYVSELGSCGQFDLNCLANISCERSNEIIKNLAARNNKKGVLLKAIELCPFNPNIYYHAHSDYLKAEGKTVASEFGELIHYFGFEDLIPTLLTPLEDLAANAQQDLEQCKFSAAKEKYCEIARLFPESSVGWKGLLFSETELFHNLSPDQNEVNRYLEQIKSTSSNADVSDILTAYSEYNSHLETLATLNRRKKSYDEQCKRIRLSQQMASCDPGYERLGGGVFLVLGALFFVLSIAILCGAGEDDGEGIATAGLVLGSLLLFGGYNMLIKPMREDSARDKEYSQYRALLNSVSEEIQQCTSNIENISFNF